MDSEEAYESSSDYSSDGDWAEKMTRVGAICQCDLYRAKKEAVPFNTKVTFYQIAINFKVGSDYIKSYNDLRRFSCWWYNLHDLKKCTCNQLDLPVWCETLFFYYCLYECRQVLSHYNTISSLFPDEICRMIASYTLSVNTQSIMKKILPKYSYCNVTNAIALLDKLQDIAKKKNLESDFDTLVLRGNKCNHVLSFYTSTYTSFIDVINHYDYYYDVLKVYCLCDW